jgi:hypothetical protein
MIVILDQAAFSISQNNECIATIPKDAPIPTSLAEDTPTGIDTAPSQGPQI